MSKSEDEQSRGSQIEVCALPDGTRVRYSLQKRGRDKFYRACFTGLYGKRKELSTKEQNKKRAREAAWKLIAVEFTPREIVNRPTWEEAIELLKEYAAAENLRQTSVDQYLFAVNSLKRISKVESPADVTPQIAQQYKNARMRLKVKPRTVAGNIDNLKIIYGNWWIKKCGILKSNPFAEVTPPKLDKKPPRIVSTEEFENFKTWLKKRFSDWRLPLLFLEVKAKIGCRITELAYVRVPQLKEGRIHFSAETTKGRKTRVCKLPPDLFAELVELAKSGYVFQKFSVELQRFYRKSGKGHHASAVGEFTPEQLKEWMQRQKLEYIKETGADMFKLHNLRGTAMSRARSHGISSEDAAIAFGCNPQTMRDHYLAIDEVAVSDVVMDRI